MKTARSALVLMSVLAAAAAGCSSSSSSATGDGGAAGDDSSATGDGGPSGGQDSGGGATPDGSVTDGGAGGHDGSTGSHDSGSQADTGSTSSMDSGLTAEMNQWLVPMNAARAAVGEKPLGWDPIAAQVAASYAAMCTFAHNANRSTQYQQLGGGSGGLGENIAAGAPTQTPAAAVASWVAEQQYYDHATNTCASGQQCGHYTQIVWSTTTAVGCAHVSCTTNTPFSGFPDWDFSVCDFSPPGNFTGQSPY